jgi:hypothetical protein
MEKDALIERTKKWGVIENPDGTKTIKMKLDFRGSVNNAIRSCGDTRFPDGLDSWGIKEACRLYYEGREAWLNGDFETVADLFGILV